MLPLPDILIWAALALATLLCLARQRLPGFLLLGLALLLALWLDRVTPTALLMTLAALWLAWRLPSLSGHGRALAWGALLTWALALTLHLVPGFNNLKVLDQVLAGPSSVPFNMYLNLDKPLLFFGLLLACPTLLGKGGTIQWRFAGPVAATADGPAGACLAVGGTEAGSGSASLVVAVCAQQPAVHLCGGGGAVSRGHPAVAGRNATAPGSA